MAEKGKKMIYYILPVLSIGILVVLWGALCVQKPDIMPTPAAVIKKIADITVNPISNATLPVHILVSLGRVLSAFAAACVFGIVLGILMGWYPTFHDIAWPVFEIIRPIPPIAWIPLIILWCGIGETSKVIIVFIGAVVPIVLNTYSGIRQVDPMLFKAAKSCQPAVHRSWNEDVSVNGMDVCACGGDGCRETGRRLFDRPGNGQR